MKQFNNVSIKCRSWCVWGIFALSTCVALVVYQKQAYDTTLLQAEKQLLQLAQHKRTLIEQQLKDAGRILDEALVLVSLAAAKSINQVEISQKFDDLLRHGPAVTTLLWINADGDVVASNRATLLGNNFKDSERYKAISGSPSASKTYLSEPFVTPIGKFTFSLGGMVLGKGGTFNGYVLAIFSPQPILEMLQQDIAHNDVAVALVHDSGKVIFRIPDNDERIAKELRDYPDAIFWKFMKSGSDSHLFNGIIPNTGKRNIINYQRVTAENRRLDHSLIIGAGIENDSLFSEWRIANLKYTLGWLALVILSAILIIWKNSYLKTNDLTHVP